MSDQIICIRANSIVDGISTSLKANRAILVTNGRH